MANLISVCYVIQSKDFGVEPIIYLRKPTLNVNEEIHEFGNPFCAKKFIKSHYEHDITVIVTKKEFSQLLKTMSVK